MSRPARARRVQVDLPLHLSVTLEGQAEECSRAYTALLDDIVETVERLARRYHLRADRGESLTARLPEECDVTELPPLQAGAPGLRAPRGTAARGTPRGSAATPGGRPRLQVLRGGAGRSNKA